MKIEYQKQAQGSFLILGEMEQASAFFLQMLAENEIAGLFPCSLWEQSGNICKKTGSDGNRHTDIFYSSLSGFIKAAGIFPACRWFITFPGNDLFL